jgi:hypothetical protein
VEPHPLIHQLKTYFGGGHNVLELLLGWPFGYNSNLLQKITIEGKFVLFLRSFAHFFFNAHPFLFNDMYKLGSNGSTKFLEPLLFLIPYGRLF